MVAYASGQLAQKGNEVRIALEDTAGDEYEFCPAGSNIVITNFGITLDETVAADVTAPVVALDLEPTAGSATGRTEKATVTIPDGAAQGKVYQTGQNLTPFVAKPGERVVIELKTQAADSGTAAGGGYVWFNYWVDPEVAGNNSNITEVAS